MSPPDPPSLLIVEDDEGIGGGLLRAVTGYTATWCRDATDALRHASEAVDLILLDLGLPDMDGLDLCRRLRRASPGAIRQILDVLLGNALLHGEGDVTLSGSRVGQGAVVAVADHGQAIVDETEIFIRRNTTSAGSGIGLALARRLAEAEEMRLVLANRGPGVAFHLVFGGRGQVDRQASEAPSSADDASPARRS